MRAKSAALSVRNLAAIAFAGIVLAGPGIGKGVAATIEIDGVIVNMKVQWVVGGNPAANVPVNPGDTLVWKAVIGRHGIVFDTQALAEAFLTFQTGGTLPKLEPQTVMGESVWGTAPQTPAGAPVTLAEATVKASVAAGTTLGFFCSQHGRVMSGSLTTLKPVSNDSPVDPGGLNDPRIKRFIKAEVVALDQAFMCNRLGTAMPQGMIFALKRDVVPNNDASVGPAGPGCVTLRPGKRARPIVLRANVGDCLEITFTNLLAADPPMLDQPLERPSTRSAGVHVAGLEMIGSINSDASYVGLNLNSLTPGPDKDCEPGESKIYRFYARAEGTYLLYSTAADVGAGLDTAQLTAGLFGSVIVEPPGSEWYRSQVTKKDLDFVSTSNHLPHNPGLPLIDYDKVYPDGTTYEDLSPDGSGRKTPIPSGTPILSLVKAAADVAGKPAFELVHTDLTAIITGPERGPLTETGVGPNPVYPNPLQPYREFSIHYHDAISAVQAFNEFNSPPSGETRLTAALSAGQDNFAINYGMAGIGAEIWANRIKVGPMARSVESKFEEFFLSSWVVGDPAMIVDNPANKFAHPDTAKASMAGRSRPRVPSSFPKPYRTLLEPTRQSVAAQPAPRATRAMFPDDPSNVYHSYLNDHVRFRIMHAGGNITHIHHLHAHQWLRNPESDKSLLLDSQTITPGDGFTQEIIYGSGNRNLTPGDSIFHCHFYPHFAQGMWSLWRVHDVFEAGTELDSNGIPVVNTRALPDGEIPNGTPIPALVPIPRQPMAPVPAPTVIKPLNDPKNPTELSGYRAELVDKNDMRNPGYPFFVPGVGGRRSPHPPLDFAVENGETLDGGLPRHIVVGGDISYEKHNAYDFTKENANLSAVQLDENGTDVERLAMTYHEKGQHPTVTPDGTPATFETNGKKAVHGAPYADPIGGPYTKPGDVGDTITYKAADIQLDVVLNKKGWHFPQQRILTLWGDVRATLENKKIPEPFFFRANSGDVIEYWQANLVPSVYELDDFQVRTPTDIVGQHIHLVKFDVTSSDGSANGFNYEDGTFSPDEVRDRIDAITRSGGLYSDFGGSAQTPVKAKAIPFFGNGPDCKWLGAQATIQRWFADPIRDTPKTGETAQDRTLRSVFTHDHLGPSTHQQAGLYAALLVEPRDSKWTDSNTGLPLGERYAAPYDPTTGKPTRDGGPTSYQAIIAAKDDTTSYREFALELQDSQLAYNAASKPTSKFEKYVKYPPLVGSSQGVPTAKGWMDTMNAINPPPIRDKSGNQPTLITGGPENGTRSINYRSEPLSARIAGDDVAPMDPSHGFCSITRNLPALNSQGDPGNPISPGSDYKFPPAYTGAMGTDPYTPLLRAYENDDVQIRVLVGAHFVPHSFNLHGLKWLNEAGNTDSGYVSTQVISISEHFEMLFRLPATAANQNIKKPHPSADYLYLADSDTRGLLNGNWGLLRAYQGQVPALAPTPTNPKMKAPDITVANTQEFYNDLVTAGKVRDYKVYAVQVNAVNDARGSNNSQGLIYYDRGLQKLADPDALIYVTDQQYDPKSNVFLPGFVPEPLVLRANAGDLIRVHLTNLIPKPADAKIGQRVGLHAQLVSYDVTTSDGFNGGNNAFQTVAVGDNPITYTWYAGNINVADDGAVTGEPVEFGAIGLTPSDPASSTTKSQVVHGLFGTLVIEPLDSSWEPDVDSRAQATVTLAGSARSQFREFVLMEQDFAPVQGAAQGIQGANYKAEPLSYRMNYQTDEKIPDFNEIDISDAVSDLVSVVDPDPSRPVFSDPQTPLFHAPAGLPVRFRVVHAAGNSYTPLTLHGHTWKWVPTKKGTKSTVLGNDSPSLNLGTLGAVPANSQFNLLIDSAGGSGKVTGDYLYRAFPSTQFGAGIWGVFRVGKPDADDLKVRAINLAGNAVTIKGRVWKKLGASDFAKTVTLSTDGAAPVVVGTTNVDPTDGTFELKGTVPQPAAVYALTSSGGGAARVVIEPLQAQVRKAPSAQPLVAGDRRRFNAERFLPQEMPRPAAAPEGSRR